jgi:Uma2 family endonuclease
MASSSSMDSKGGRAMTPAPPLMTLDEYLKTPETVKPTELIYGVLRVAESPTARHQSAVLQLVRALDAHVRARQLGEMWLAPLDVVLDAERALVVQPDLFFVSNARAYMVRHRVYGAPNLVVEVLSPHPRIGSAEERVGWFAEYGAQECWLVHQDDVTITVMQFADGHVASRKRYTKRQPIESMVLPDFKSTLDDIFRDAVPSHRDW